MKKVLPYPTPDGLFSKVKRYISGSALGSRVSSRQPSNPPPQNDTSINSGSILPASYLFVANTTLAGGEDAPNRVLSSFFQEKGDQPLSQIEYEGVMSLLEKSKANITLPLPDAPLDSKTATPKPEPLHRNLIAPQPQKSLRNISMYDANNSSFVTPDYNPVYHTFSDTSRGNISVKRVYQFSGLPSPYRTRIRAPNLAARKAKRIASAAAATHNKTTEATLGDLTTESFSSRPRSKAANSLLSILDGNKNSDIAHDGSVSKPLYNPYTKPKRRALAQDGSAPKKPTILNADNIPKTVLYNKAEDLSDDQKQALPEAGKGEEGLFASKINGDSRASADSESVGLFGSSSSKSDASSLFGNSKSAQQSSLSGGATDGDAKTPFKFESTVKAQSDNKPSFGFGNAGLSAFKSEATSTESQESNNGLTSGTDTTEKPAFSFGAKADSTATKPEFSFSSKADSTEATKPAFSFGSKADSTGASKPAFSFGTKADSPATTTGFSFGSKADSSESTKPAFSFGSKSEPPTGNQFKFGAGASSNSGSETKQEAVETKTESDQLKQSGTSGFKSGISRPVFGFDSTNTSKPSLFGAEKDGKPGFAFGSQGKPGSFGSDKVKPDFGSDLKVEEAKPSFTFGSKPAAPINFGTQLEKPGASNDGLFSFGSTSGAQPAGSLEQLDAKAESKQETKAQASGNGLFNFGAANGEHKPAFNFGAKSDDGAAATKPDSSEDKKPLFSFGSASNGEAKSGFSFGSTKEGEKKSAFSFGSTSNGDEKAASFVTKANEGEKKPVPLGTNAEGEKKSFSFGSTTNEGEKKPFTFGSTANANAFSFGKSNEESKPAISFGTPSDEKKPGVSFGASSDEKKPAFSFGSTSEKKPAFSFGTTSTTEEKKPAFSFASTEKPFSFGKEEKSQPFLFGAPSGSNGTQKLGPSNGHGEPAFDFPAAPVRDVAVDLEKAKEHELLFDF